MRSWRSWWIGAVLLIGLWTPGVSADSINEKIDKERRTLEQLKDQIEEKRRQADEAGKKRESIPQGIQTLDERHMRYRQSHQEISRKLRKKDQEIESINVQIARLRDGARRMPIIRPSMRGVPSGMATSFSASHTPMSFSRPRF